jgi:hypothetical protein
MKTDGSKKFRSVIRGYEQIPGVDFVESFSPLATNTTIKVTKALTMEQMALHEDWVIEMVDVEAAFLNVPVETDVYIELPEGLRKYQEVDRFDLREDMIIRLKRAQYGLVQSPQLCMLTFAKILAKLGLAQCKTDPACLFTLHDEDGILLAIVVVYCDDSIITGFREAVDRLKRGISCAVTISDLEKLVRHLGVDYEFGRDDYGVYIKSSMTEYIESIVRDFEKDFATTLKDYRTPGAAVTPPLHSTSEDEIVRHELFRSYVGRVMFACMKTEPTISNACRELTCHLNAPNETHWTALKYLIGYLKNEGFHGLKMRAPNDRRVVAFVDSDYASDRGDRKSISGYIVSWCHGSRKSRRE